MPAEPQAEDALAASSAPDGRRALEVLAIGSLGAFVVFLDTTIVNIAFPTISRSFSTTTGHLAWVLNAYSLVFAALLIPAGRIADRYGRKRVFLIGAAGFALMSALCGAAPNADVLIAGRALQAIFAAFVVPTSLALILPWFPAERRHVAVGTWGAMAALAAATGPTIGALLTEYASWRWIFLVNVPICAVIVFFGAKLLAESNDPHAVGLPDPLGIVLIAASPALLSYAIIEGPDRGWSDLLVVGSFVASAVLMAAFLGRSLVSAQPVIDLSLFRIRQFRETNVATLLFATAFYGMLLSNVVFLQTNWHYSVVRAALASVPGPLLVAVVARTAAKVASRVGYRPVLLAGAIVWAAGAVGFAVSVPDSPHWLLHWLPWNLLIGLGIGLTLTVQSGAVVEALPANRFAVGSAVNSSLRQLGAVLGVSLFVAVQSGGGADGFKDTWWLFAVIGLVSGLVVLVPPVKLRTSRPGTAAEFPRRSSSSRARRLELERENRELRAKTALLDRALSLVLGAGVRPTPSGRRSP